MQQLKSLILGTLLTSVSTLTTADETNYDEWQLMPELTFAVGADGVERFDISRFKPEANISQDTLAGTWVAVWDIDQQRSNILAAPFVLPHLKTSRLEMLVIKPSGQGYTIGHCFGNGMEPVTINGQQLTTESRNLTINNNSNMTLSQSYTKSVTMPALVGDWERSYDEKATIKAQYVKISDSVKPIGEFSQHWSTSSDEYKKQVYCSSLDNMNDGTYRAYVGSDDKMKWVVSTSVDPSVPTALIEEPEFKGKGSINTGIELCMASLDILTAKPDDIFFDYYVINQQTGTTVYGEAQLNLPVKK